MPRLRCLIFAVALASGSAAAGPQEDAVDAFVAEQMRVQSIPGLSLAVVQDGELAKIRAYGVADRALGTPATPATVYKIASVSKPLIAAGIMLLVQEGRLGLDVPIVTLLEGARVSWGRITVRHLLSHTSGLIREGPGFDVDTRHPDIDVIASAYGEPLLFAPGERWEYSNLGYFILAEIIRRVSGQPWDEFVAARIFEPTGMRSTGTTATWQALPDRAVGHLDNDRLEVAPDWPALRPSGAFVSTVVDLARWGAALSNGEILTEASLGEMGQPTTLNDGTTVPYGLGWQIGEVADRRSLHHYGGMTGFRAGFARFPDDGLTVIVLMNLSDADVHAIVRGVALLYLAR